LLLSVRFWHVAGLPAVSPTYRALIASAGLYENSQPRFSDHTEPASIKLMAIQTIRKLII